MSYIDKINISLFNVFYCSWPKKEVMSLSQRRTIRRWFDMYDVFLVYAHHSNTYCLASHKPQTIHVFTTVHSSSLTINKNSYPKTPPLRFIYGPCLHLPFPHQSVRTPRNHLCISTRSIAAASSRSTDPMH